MKSEHQFEHNKLIMNQFSKQAVPFAKKVPEHSNEAAFRLIIETIGIDKSDTALDVACGPGMLSCAVAQVAGHVEGIDLVPAMIEQARLLQTQKKLVNMDWKIGDVLHLPFPDSSFSVVLTRFSFHHFLDPQLVLREMVRVCKPKGKVAIIDAYTISEAHGHLHNLIEKLRDDSHVRALYLSEIEDMVKEAGLRHLKSESYRLEIEFERQLKASFPHEGDDKKIRQLVMDDKEGIVSCRKDGVVYLVYPIGIVVGQKL